MRAEDRRLLEEVIDSYAPSLMNLEKVVGMQIFVISPATNERLSHSYGYINSERNDPVNNETIFFAPALVQPVTAYLAAHQTGENFEKTYPFVAGTDLAGMRIPDSRENREDSDQRNTAHRFQIQNPENREISIADLLSHTAGLPVSRSGIYPDGPQAEKQATSEIYSLDLKYERQSGIRRAAEAYALIENMLIEKTETSAESMIAALFESYGLQRTFLNNPESENQSPLFESAGNYYYEKESPYYSFTMYDSLYTTAENYGRFLEIMRNSNTAEKILQPYFSYHESLGGVSPGFSFAYPVACQKPYYIQQSVSGGASALAALSPDPDGGIIVILASSENIKLMRSLFRRLARDVFPPCKERPVDNFDPKDAWGFYRPVNAVPEQSSFFNFISDIRLRRNASGLVELAGFFQSTPAIHLKKIDEDLWYAEGNAQMDGWHLRFIRNESGRITGLVSDQIEFRKVPGIFSLWGIIVSFPVLFVVMLFSLILYLLKTTRTDEQ